MKFLRTFLMVVGAVALLALAVGLIAGAIVVRRGFSAREQPSSIEAFIARSLRSVSIPTRARNLQNPVKPTARVLQSAKEHWADHCAICHANDGSGQTDIGRGLYPPAPDMRKAPTQNQTDGELYYTIQNGIRLTGMPAWGAAGEEDLESWELVHFIRSLPTLTAEELREMEQLNPKSAHESKEEREEEEFLNEGG